MKSITLVTLRLPRELARTYGAIAAWQGIPRAHLMGQVLDEYLANHEMAQTLVQFTDDTGEHHGGGGQKQNGRNGTQPKRKQGAPREP